MLIPEAEWACTRIHYASLLKVPLSAEEYLKPLLANIEAGLASVAEARELGKLDIDDNGDLHLPSLEALPDEPGARRTRDAIVDRAVKAAIAAAKPGVRAREVDAAARTVIAEAGYGETFSHGLGHGVGLQIHEAPGINATAAGTLLAGSAVTVEPGVYLPDRGGVRIEDTLVIGEHGPDLLTRFPKELQIL